MLKKDEENYIYLLREVEPDVAKVYTTQQTNNGKLSSKQEFKQIFISRSIGYILKWIKTSWWSSCWHCIDNRVNHEGLCERPFVYDSHQTTRKFSLAKYEENSSCSAGLDWCAWNKTPKVLLCWCGHACGVRITYYICGFSLTLALLMSCRWYVTMFWKNVFYRTQQRSVLLS